MYDTGYYGRKKTCWYKYGAPCNTKYDRCWDKQYPCKHDYDDDDEYRPKYRNPFCKCHKKMKDDDGRSYQEDMDYYRKASQYEPPYYDYDEEEEDFYGPSCKCRHKMEKDDYRYYQKDMSYGKQW